MCGITGLYAFKKEAIQVGSKVEQSLIKLSKRGPDNKFFTNERNAVLGHTRLCIIDTTEAANQPMEDHTGRYVIVFNGEIFNYTELANRHLDSKWSQSGLPRTHSDTEVLLYLLIHYGTECLSWLSGFFALAFYDRQSGELILARDRYGKKPLLWYADDEKLVFSSEMKGLLEWGIPRRLDYESLYQYLQLNYVPPGSSILCGVNKVSPGTWMKIVETGISTGAYYTLQVNRQAYQEMSYEQAQGRLVQLMDQAVQERLIADVPLGAFLSGGIDSSVIVALAKRHTSKLRTFSVGYRDNKLFDETAYAQLVAKKYSTDHTVFSLSNNDFLEHVYEVLDYLDEPFADSSAIPTYILCKRTREHVTVALSGDGGDEVFSGYNKHAAEWKARDSGIINRLIVMGAPVWKMLPKGHNNKLWDLFRQLDRFAEGAGMDTDSRYWRWASISSASDVTRLLSAKSLSGLNKEIQQRRQAEYTSMIRTADFNEILLADMKLVLGGDMLVKVDQMSMANSLEVRSPFLAHPVVDFAFGLPASYKINGKMKKRIVQDAFRDMLPAELYNRPKHGFEIPLLDWLRKELWPLINDDLLKAGFIAEQGIFSVQEIERLKQQLKSSSPGTSTARIWALIAFQYWWKKYYS